MSTRTAGFDTGDLASDCQTQVDQIETTWVQLKRGLLARKAEQNTMSDLRSEIGQLKGENGELQSENERLRECLKRIRVDEALRLREILNDLETPLDTRKRKLRRTEDVVEQRTGLEHSEPELGDISSGIRTSHIPSESPTDLANGPGLPQKSFQGRLSPQNAQSLSKRLPILKSLGDPQSDENDVVGNQHDAHSGQNLHQPKTVSPHRRQGRSENRGAEGSASVPNSSVRHPQNRLAPREGTMDGGLAQLGRLGTQQASKDVKASQTSVTISGSSFGSEAALEVTTLTPIPSGQKNQGLGSCRSRNQSLNTPSAASPSSPAPITTPTGLPCVKKEQHLEPLLPVAIRLLRDSWQSQSAAPTDPAEVPEGVRSSVIELVERVKFRYRHKWLSQIRSLADCVPTTLHESSTFWVKGRERQLCCRTCFNKRRACVIIDRRSDIFDVLPLPTSVRPRGAKPGEDAYYINTDYSANSMSMKYAPWSA